MIQVEVVEVDNVETEVVIDAVEDVVEEEAAADAVVVEQERMELSMQVVVVEGHNNHSKLPLRILKALPKIHNQIIRITVIIRIMTNEVAEAEVSAIIIRVEEEAAVVVAEIVVVAVEVVVEAVAAAVRHFKMLIQYHLLLLPLLPLPTRMLP
jgi:hypothetical protein